MGEDFAGMGSLSSKNKDVQYLFCAIDVFTKYARVKPLKDKKVKSFYQNSRQIYSWTK